MVAIDKDRVIGRVYVYSQIRGIFSESLKVLSHIAANKSFYTKFKNMV